jgi:hypothetical protein
VTDYYTFTRPDGLEVFNGQYYNKHVSERKLESTISDQIGDFSMEIHTTEEIGNAGETKVRITLVELSHSRHGSLGVVVFFRKIFLLEFFSFLNEVNMCSVPGTLKSIDHTLEGIWSKLNG